MRDKTEWISATEVASYIYCPESWRLEHGLRLQADNEQQRAFGERTHRRWQRTERQSSRLVLIAAITFFVVLIMWALR